MKFILILASFALFGATAAQAQDFHEQTLEVNGKVENYRLHLSINGHHERQVIIEHEEVRAFAPTLPVTLLIGRDLDGDGKFDTWFYLDNDGMMQAIEMTAQKVDGWDAAQVILRDHTKLENRWLAGVMLGSLANFVLTTGKGSNASHFLQLLAMQEVELLDLDVQARRIARNDPKSPKLGPIYRTLSDGWAMISKEADARMHDEVYAALEYFGMYLAGDAAVTLLGKLGPLTTKIIEGNETLSAAAEICDRFLTKVRTHVRVTVDNVNVLSKTSEIITDAIVTPYQFFKLSIVQRINVLVESLEARGRLGRFAARIVLASQGYAGSAIKNIPYMVWTQSLQLVSEIYDKRQVLFSRNPIILKNRVLSDKDLIQDMSYMTMETAVTATIIHRNGSGLAGYAKAGLFSMVDSNAMNYWVKGETDLKRDALDTGWEVGIGNLQTVCDMRTLSFFENLSEKTGNKNLKIVGYLVTGIDQFVGYVAYGKLTDWYEKNHKKPEKPVEPGPLTLTPILAPMN